MNNERKAKYLHLSNLFKGSEPCLIRLDGKFILKLEDGTELKLESLGGGDGGEIYFNQEYKFAIKLNYLDGQNLTTMETDILQKTTELALSGECVNMPLMYHHSFCENSYLVEDSSFQAPNYVIICELADMDLNNFLTKHYGNKIIIDNVIVQSVIAIYFLHQLGFIHDDAHAKNFLVMKVDPGGYFNYEINGRDVQIPNLGYLVLIWDFGYSLLKQGNEHRILEDYQFFKYYMDYDLRYVNPGLAERRSLVSYSERKARHTRPETIKMYENFLSEIDPTYFTRKSESELINQIVNEYQKFMQINSHMEDKKGIEQNSFGKRGRGCSTVNSDILYLRSL
jgi:hypothetical protein